jgi:hypothetical protein
MMVRQSEAPTFGRVPHRLGLVEKPGSESGCHGQANSLVLWRICLSVSFSRNLKKDTDKEDRARKPLGLPCPWHPYNQIVVFD